MDVGYGRFVKYDADPFDPRLWDKLEVTACSPWIRDPDFWSNDPYVIWAVCGPFIRAGIEPGDVIFFVPQARVCREANLDYTPITGVMKVSDVIPDSHTVLQDTRLTADYRRRYHSDLKVHVRDDLDGGRRRTAAARQRNIPIGEKPASFWRGRDGLDVFSALHIAGLHELARIFPHRRHQALRWIDPQQCERLLSAVKARSGG